MLPNFTYERPGSVDDALELSSSDGAVLHAGGTDLLGCLRDGVFSADKVVSLSGLEELRGIQATRDGGLRIGARHFSGSRYLSRNHIGVTLFLGLGGAQGSIG